MPNFNVRPALKCRMIWAIIGVVVGLGIFGSFGFYFKNWHCAAWGLASGLFAGLTLGVHIEYRKHEWNRLPILLSAIMVCGCLAQFASITSFVVYLVLAIKEHQGATPWKEGYYVTCVWCLMTWKWAFLLFFYARSYRKLIVPSLDTGSVNQGSGVPYQRIGV